MHVIFSPAHTRLRNWSYQPVPDRLTVAGMPKRPQTLKPREDDPDITL
jgi:hypothetical protein